jgi:hypothetical protein
MGPSVDVVGSCARAPIREVLRHDEEEVIILLPAMPPTGRIVVNYFVIICRSFPWMRGLPPQAVKI